MPFLKVKQEAGNQCLQKQLYQKLDTKEFRVALIHYGDIDMRCSNCVLMDEYENEVTQNS